VSLRGLVGLGGVLLPVELFQYAIQYQPCKVLLPFMPSQSIITFYVRFLLITVLTFHYIIVIAFAKKKGGITARG
jgi:hypothetical protein